MPLDRNLIHTLHSHAINVDVPISAYARDLIRTNLERDNTQDEVKRIWRTLTDRQRQVALLIYRDFTYQVIGEKLYLSPHTARSNARALMRLYGVHSKRQLRTKFAMLPEEYLNTGQDPETPA